MGFGPKTVTTGGKALKFWSSVRIEVSYVGRWKQGDRHGEYMDAPALGFIGDEVLFLHL